MAFFSSNVDALMRPGIEKLADESFGTNMASVLAFFNKKAESADAILVPIQTGFGAGMGADAQTAYNNATLANRDKFNVTPFRLYGYSGKIDLGQAIWTTGNDNAVADLLLKESETAQNSAKSQMDQALCSTGYGTLGAIASHSGSGPYTLVLSRASDLNNFEVGNVCLSKATEAAGSLDTGSFTVTNKTKSSNSITVTASGGWTPTDTHTIGLQGTYAASTSPVSFLGIPAWIVPDASRPLSSTLWNGVDRSKDEVKYAGHALDITTSGESILSGLNKLAHEIADTPGPGKVDMVVMNFKTIAKIKASLQTQVRYERVPGRDIDRVFNMFVIDGPDGDMAVVGNTHWPEDQVAILASDTWHADSPGNQIFRPATSTGNPVDNIVGQDAAIAAYRATALVFCSCPGRNGLLTINPNA